MNDSARKTWLQYEAGKNYKRRIGLYERVRQNERFYRGDQWQGIDSRNLPKPIFNIVRRIVDYLACTVSPGRVSINYVDEDIPYCNDEATRQKKENVLKMLNSNAKYRWERSKMDSKIYKLVSDAALTGDGVLYCYWDDEQSGDGKYSGDIKTDILENTSIFVADVNKADIQSQDYIILSGRASVASLKKEAKANGASPKEIEKIVPDEIEGWDRAGDLCGIELEGKDEAKATYLIKFWKEDGRVCFEKSTRNCVIRRSETPCKLYPIAYFNWFPTKSSFHGTSPISDMIANQKYINRAYAMVMKHMSDTAFSKVIYDKSKIPEWSNEVGEAIAALGSTNVSDAVSVVGTGKLQDKYIDFLSNVISVTKELGGATETALGNIAPTNTSAILAIQEASKIPLKLVRAALYKCIEELADIWVDMALSYYCDDRLVPMLDSNGACISQKFNFEELRTNRIRAYVDVVDTSSYSSSIAISILDKLLDKGHITPVQYLSRIPSDYVENYSELIGEIENGI